MSTEYKAALIYGYNCDPTKFSREEREALEDFGWDIIEDSYDDNFLYIGKIISQTEHREEAKVDAIAALTVAVYKFKSIQDATPAEVLDKLNCGSISLYHICYAT